MESAGSEKRLQTLFHELKLADGRVAPEFVWVWNRAQISPGSPRGFKISLAVATALTVVALSSLAFWWKNWQPTQRSNQAVVSRPVTPDLTPAPRLATPDPALPGSAAPNVLVKFARRNVKVVARRHRELNTTNVATQEDVSISSWQSPTARLLQSPADNVLTSLPQLDRSLTNLKTFLPDTPQ